jgi:serralysin
MAQSTLFARVFACALSVRQLIVAPQSHRVEARKAIGRVAKILVAAVTAFGIANAPTSAHAAFHLFYIQEAYSNASGSVQFVELFTNFDFQQFVNSSGVSLTSNEKTFNFPTDTPAPTGGHAVLLATAGFGSLPGGATPDYTIPSNFFNPAGDTLDFGGGVDTKSFTSMPTDGVHSLDYAGQFAPSATEINSPRNYAGEGGSLNSGPPALAGDYNGNGVVDMADYVLWRSGGPLQNEVSSTGVVDQADYDAWRARFGNTSGSGSAVSSGANVPEPVATSVLIALAWAGLQRLRRNGRD